MNDGRKCVLLAKHFQVCIMRHVPLRNLSFKLLHVSGHVLRCWSGIRVESNTGFCVTTQSMYFESVFHKEGKSLHVDTVQSLHGFGRSAFKFLTVTSLVRLS